jgi:hypothetical protein
MKAGQILSRLAVPALILSSAWTAPAAAKPVSKVQPRTVTWCDSAAARIASGRKAAGVRLNSARAIAGSKIASANTAARAGLAAVSTGGLLAVAGPAANYFGVAAVEHSSSALILSSVGPGGTGYIAGTLGGYGATALGAASTFAAGVTGVASAAAGAVTAPAVMGVGAGALAVGGGAYVYCRFRP